MRVIAAYKTYPDELRERARRLVLDARALGGCDRAVLRAKAEALGAVDNAP